MLRNLVDLTEKDIKESCERMMNSNLVITDMSDYFSYKLYTIHKGLNTQKEEKILETSMSETLNNPKTLKLTRDNNMIIE